MRGIYTVSDIARDIGVPVSYLHDILSGRRTSKPVVKKLADRCGLSNAEVGLPADYRLAPKGCPPPTASPNPTEASQ